MVDDAMALRVLAHRTRRGSASCLYGLEATPNVTDTVQAAGWMWRGLVVWHKPRPVLCPVSSGVTPSISSMAPRDVFSGTQANACPAFSGIR